LRLAISKARGNSLTPFFFSTNTQQLMPDSEAAVLKKSQKLIIKYLRRHARRIPDERNDHIGFPPRSQKGIRVARLQIRRAKASV
jgi:hypothetical protein